ncbi:MAG: sodium:solute symporter family protein [Clostridia bacterium]|nr:sodium:solute symporter family protein [Clostridia bacterium]
MENMTLFYGMLAGYIIAIALLGYLGYRHTRSAEDFMIAGGNVHPFLMALAYGSTFISTSAIVGFGGAAGVYGLSLLWLTVFTILVGVFIAFVFYGRKTRELAHGLGIKTFPEMLGTYFDSSFIRRFSAGLLTVAMPIYAAAVMIGGARFIEESFHISYQLALYGFASIIIVYVFFGGLRGVIYTDAFQSIIMFFGMIIVLGLTYWQLGGVTAAHESLGAMHHLVPEGLRSLGHAGWTSMPVFGTEIWWYVVSTLVLGVGIGVLAQPQLAVRYMTVKSSREIYRAMLVGGIFILCMTGVAFTVGALSNVYFHKTSGMISLSASEIGGAGANVDKIIPLFITQAMPEWVLMLFLLTLLSAAMSTLSGQFHMISTSLAYDLNPAAGENDRQTLIWTRMGTIMGFLLTLIFAFSLPSSIIALATALFFGLCAAVFLPVYTAALYWPKVTKSGAIWSMVGSTMLYLYIVLFVHEKEAALFGICEKLFGVKTLASAPWTYIDPIVIALPFSAAMLVLASLLTQPSTKKAASLITVGERQIR